MLARSRPHLTFANVAATLALFLAVTGGIAWALENNSVKSKHIVNGQVKGVDLGDGAVSEAKLAPPGGFTSAGLGASSPSCLNAADTWATVSPNVNNDTSYHRDRNGFVHLRGIPITCGVPPSGDTIFTLPAGSRPASQEVQLALYEQSPAARVDINSNGDVVAAGSPVSGEWISLDGMTFRCGPSGQDGCP